MPSATQFVGSSALLDNLSLLLRHPKPSFRGVFESIWCLPQCLVGELPLLRRFWSAMTSLDVARGVLSEVRLFNVMRLALTHSPCLQCIDSSTCITDGMVVKGRGRKVIMLN